MFPDAEITVRSLSYFINETNALPFSLADKRSMVQAVKKVYEGLNPHRFLHDNFLGIDFSAALDAIELSEDLSNTDFYVKMEQTFQLMDDKHSVFVLPYPFNSSVATLGFEPKIFFDKDGDDPMKRRYVVSDFPTNLIPEGSTIAVGSEILSFNGVPIDEAVRELGRNSYGSNKAAQIDSGVNLLAFRVLMGEQIPFEPTVDIGFVNADGEEGVVTLTWLFVEFRLPEMLDTMVRHFTPGDSGPCSRPRSSAWNIQKPDKSASVGPKLLNSNVRVVEEGRIPIPVDPAFQARFQAEVLSTSNGPIGRFVLPDFGSLATPELVAEITRVLSILPENGLIMDLRNNGGGQPDYVKLLVEMVSGITPPQQPTSLRATQFTKDAFDSVTDELTPEEFRALSGYRASIGTAIKVGEPFSGATVGLYSEVIANVSVPVPRAYFGPVVTLVNGITYSAGDLYSSLQADLDLSLLVGVSDNVGAGGASTLGYQTLAEMFPGVLDPLPGVTDYGHFTSSFSRYYRSGKKLGAIVENFGVKPEVRYYPTLDDALKQDCDLFEFLGQKLQEIKTGEELEPRATPEDLVFASPEEIL